MTEREEKIETAARDVRLALQAAAAELERLADAVGGCDDDRPRMPMVVSGSLANIDTPLRLATEQLRRHHDSGRMVKVTIEYDDLPR